MKPNRRHILTGAAAGAVYLSGAGSPILGSGPALAADIGKSYSARAVALVSKSVVIDMLGVLRLEFTAKAYSTRLSEQEIADFRASGITAFHNATGVGGPNARQDALAFLAAWHGFVGRHPELMLQVASVNDIDKAKRDGKVAIISGLQNADEFSNADDVQFFYDLGLRCAQLTYNSQNLLGSGSTERVDGGLTDYGTEIVAAMNKAGMLVDVSHCGDRTTLDAIAAADGPIAITHSNCRALVNHPRCKTDEAIRALAKKGGVMGVTGVRNFVRDRDPTTVSHIADHIDHIVKLVGIDHVGIGTDADLYGYDDMPADQNKMLREAFKSSYAFRDKIDVDGFDHPRKIYDLTEELIRRGYSEPNIAMVLGGNFRRLLGEIWK
ncbi:MAG: membrane dipeptidase [Pseudomonadota bacterium]